MRAVSEPSSGWSFRSRHHVAQAFQQMHGFGQCRPDDRERIANTLERLDATRVLAIVRVEERHECGRVARCLWSAAMLDDAWAEGRNSTI